MHGDVMIESYRASSNCFYNAIYSCDGVCVLEMSDVLLLLVVIDFDV